MQYAIQTNSSGRIYGTVSATGDSIVYVSNIHADDVALISDSMKDTHRFDFNTGRIVAKSAQTTAINKTTIQANGVDAITITGAPTDSVFTARNLTSGQEVSMAISGSDTFTSAIAGTIVLTITKWPYLDWSATVEAV